METLEAALNGQTQQMRRFLLFACLTRDVLEAKRLADVPERTWQRWKHDAAVEKLLGVALGAPKSDAIALFFGDKLPKVVQQVMDIVDMPVAEMSGAMLQTWRWAVELTMRLALGEGQAALPQFQVIVSQLREQKVIDGEYEKIDPGNSPVAEFGAVDTVPVGRRVLDKNRHADGV